MSLQQTFNRLSTMLLSRGGAGKRTAGVFPYWAGIWDELERSIQASRTVIAEGEEVFDNRFEVVMHEQDFERWMRSHRSRVQRAGEAQVARVLKQAGFPRNAQVVVHWICADPTLFPDLVPGAVRVFSDHVSEQALQAPSQRGSDQATTIVDGDEPEQATDLGDAPTATGAPWVVLSWTDRLGGHVTPLPLDGSFGRNGLGCSADARLEPAPRDQAPEHWRVSRSALRFGSDPATGGPSIENQQQRTVFLRQRNHVVALAAGDRRALGGDARVSWEDPAGGAGFEVEVSLPHAATWTFSGQPPVGLPRPQGKVTSPQGHSISVDLSLGRGHLGLRNLDCPDLEVDGIQIQPGETLVVDFTGPLGGRADGVAFELRLGSAP